MPTGLHLWSRTPASNATADSSVNWAEGQSPSSVNDSARAMMARIAEWRDDLGGLTTSGSATAYSVSTNRGFASAAAMDKAIITIIPHVASGAAPTLAVDGLTARQLRTASGVNVPAGALTAGTPYMLIYLNSTTEFILTGDVGAIGGLDIDGGAALTAPDTADETVLYDASATANRKTTLGNLFKVVDTFTSKTAPAAADELGLYDVTGAAAKKLLLSDLFKVIDVLAAKSAPESADEIVIYDVAGTASKKATLAQIATALPAFTTQYLTSGTGATYTTPANCRALKIRMIGAGGGGGASFTNNGSTGGTTTFNGVNANGGSGGIAGGGSNGGAGGTGGTGSGALRLAGSAGSAGQNGADFNVGGGSGGPGIFGSGAGQGVGSGAGTNAGANTGAGGGGGSGNNSSGGGGAGEYVEIVILSPAATYTYTVGAGANGGAAGGTKGGNGGSGLIIVEEYY